ncbi:MAG: LptF/LptG family permease [Verrucomicrobia bacterium]|nr:LptF/LptG family permease [Verrucomicrobiota bacterium]
MIKVWQRYFFREILKVFFFFLFGFFFLYSLIEYSMHMDDFFQNHHFQLREVVLYYINQLLKRLDFLLPMALLLSTIKVLTSLNARNEWIVLQAAGLSTRKLLQPFMIIACASSILAYLNFEYFLPSALRHIDEFRISHFHGSKLAQRRELIHLIPLKDNTKLLYQSHDKEKNVLFDVLWIKSLDDIWRIKYLNGDPANPTAEYVDHIVRNSSGFLEKKESYPKLYLADLKWHPRMARKGLIPFDQRSITELYRLRFKTKVSPYEVPKIGTSLSFKVAIPLISPLLVIALAPFCLAYSRTRHFFLIYALGLFGLFAFYMLLDSLTILSDNGVITPTMAVFVPLALFASFFTWRFALKST